MNFGPEIVLLVLLHQNMRVEPFLFNALLNRLKSHHFNLNSIFTLNIWILIRTRVFKRVSWTSIYYGHGGEKSLRLERGIRLNFYLFLFLFECHFSILNGCFFGVVFFQFFLQFFIKNATKNFLKKSSFFIVILLFLGVSLFFLTWL